METEREIDSESQREGSREEDKWLSREGRREG